MMSFFDRLKLSATYQLFFIPIPANYAYPKLWPISWKAYKEFNSIAYETKKVAGCKVYIFNSSKNEIRKKVFITHGWSSNSTHMVKFIRDLVDLNYEVYALDLPAHGGSKGFKLDWIKATEAILKVNKKFGPFYAAIGHSFGGTSLLSAATIKNVDSRFQDVFQCKKIITIASPTSMQSVIDCYIEYFELNKEQAKVFQSWIKNQNLIDPKLLDAKKLIAKFGHDTKYLACHGSEDFFISPSNSERLATVENIEVRVFGGLDHINVLYDDEVSKEICHFIHHHQYVL